jgi:hypothetical protein
MHGLVLVYQGRMLGDKVQGLGKILSLLAPQADGGGAWLAAGCLSAIALLGAGEAHQHTLLQESKSPLDAVAQGTAAVEAVAETWLLGVQTIW